MARDNMGFGLGIAAFLVHYTARKQLVKPFNVSALPLRLLTPWNTINERRGDCS
jgi:hypothetical protein